LFIWKWWFELFYININLDIHYELTADLQRILDEDLTLLQEQIEILKLEQLYNDLKNICERIEKSQSINKIFSLPFFTGPNASFGIYSSL
jgi:F0F1-type ATP synthase beta subunit